MIDKQLALAKILCKKYRGGEWGDSKEAQEMFMRQASQIIVELEAEGIYLAEWVELDEKMIR
jgi:hypothetical protein